MEVAIGPPNTIPGAMRVALSASAAVTERIRLATNVLLLPPRGNPGSFAKQTASLDAVSGDRFSLGVGLGARDDYEVPTVPLSERGKIMDGST